MEEKHFSGSNSHVYHQFTLENREKMDLVGVVNVESFDSEEIIMDTEMGLLAIKGENLHIKHLNLEQGEVKITGLVMELAYAEHKKRSGGRSKGLLEKIFK